MNSARSLARLLANPVGTPEIRRFRVSRGRPGDVVVEDRATSDRHRVYTATTVREFRAGHRAGLWYVRRVCCDGVTPESRGFATQDEAIGSLACRSWDVHRRPARAKVRVIWS